LSFGFATYIVANIEEFKSSLPNDSYSIYLKSAALQRCYLVITIAFEKDWGLSDLETQYRFFLAVPSGNKLKMVAICPNDINEHGMGWKTVKDSTMFEIQKFNQQYINMDEICNHFKRFGCVYSFVLPPDYNNLSSFNEMIYGNPVIAVQFQRVTARTSKGNLKSNVYSTMPFFVGLLLDPESKGSIEKSPGLELSVRMKVDSRHEFNEDLFEINSIEAKGLLDDIVEVESAQALTSNSLSWKYSKINFSKFFFRDCASLTAILDLITLLENDPRKVLEKYQLKVESHSGFTIFYNNAVKLSVTLNETVWGIDFDSKQDSGIFKNFGIKANESISAGIGPLLSVFKINIAYLEHLPICLWSLSHHEIIF
jgi:hypothetical protein